jgi:hypothetical protein
VSQPVDRARGFGPFDGPRPPNAAPPKGLLPWAASGPGPNATEQWNFVRRSEVANLAVPFMIHLIRDGEMSHAGAEPWHDEEAKPDQAIVDRAVWLACLLQDAVDRARPRA